MKYGLMMNDMRSSNIENIQCVKVSENRQELVDFHNSLLVNPYQDGQTQWGGKWRKSFKKGSELEWFNPVYNFNEDNAYFGGIWHFKEDAPDAEILQFYLSKY